MVILGYTQSMARSFHNRMKHLTTEIMQGTEDVVRRATMAAIMAAVGHTPVKTGKAIVSWVIGVGRPSRLIRRAPNTGSTEANRAAGAAESIAQASAIVARWRPGQGDLYITNTADHAGDLDKGTSRQAPNGMSSFALAAAQNVLRRARLLRHGR